MDTISVPATELEKLEESRKQLYKFLEKKLNPQEFSQLVNITGQVWKVANTKQWKL